MRPLTTTPELQRVHAAVREHVPYLPHDHRLDRDIAHLARAGAERRPLPLHRGRTHVHGMQAVIASPASRLVALLLRLEPLARATAPCGGRARRAGGLLLLVARTADVVADDLRLEPTNRCGPTQPIARSIASGPGRRAYRATLTRLPGGPRAGVRDDRRRWRLDARTLDWTRPRRAARAPTAMYRLERLEHSAPNRRALRAATTRRLELSRLGTDCPERRLGQRARTRAPAWMSATSRGRPRRRALAAAGGRGPISRS